MSLLETRKLRQACDRFFFNYKTQAMTSLIDTISRVTMREGNLMCFLFLVTHLDSFSLNVSL